jgi:hypothetical protein
MVLVEIDGNYINAEPMKSKTEGAMIKAYLILWERLTANGTVKPTTHIMDNKASAEYKKEIQKNCTIQLVLPNNHRQHSKYTHHNGAPATTHTHSDGQHHC